MLEKILSPHAERRPRHRLADLAEEVPTLGLTDSLAAALRGFAAAGLAVLPVVDGGRFVGLAHEEDLLDWMAEAKGRLGFFDADELHETMVATIMRTDVPSAWGDEPLDRVLPLFDAGLVALPVLEGHAGYCGLLTRRRVLAVLSHALRPERVGGMATPLGVYLTTGHHQAGVGFWGLFLSGALLTLANVALSLGLYGAQLATGIRLSEPVEAVLALVLFLVLLRLSPLAGFHAAEHQTVHAIEKGLPLSPEAVKAQPREHPRCGTNLMALLFAGQLLVPLIASEPLWLLPVAAIMYLSWRRVGGWLQKAFTTKPARPYQLKSGIRAGIELLEAYESSPNLRSGRWRRLWNMGLAQILAGAITTVALVEAATRLTPFLRGISL